MEQNDKLIDTAARTLREPVTDGRAGIDRALAQLRDEARARARTRILGYTALAASVLFMVSFWRTGRQGEAIRFELADSTGGPVALIGDFNDWNPAANPLGHAKDGWSTTLRLKPGRYRYAFVVEGSSWRADPRSPAAEDEFGTPTSVITVAN